MMEDAATIACPHCSEKFRIKPANLAQTFRCTVCQTRFVAGAEPGDVQDESGEYHFADDPPLTRQKPAGANGKSSAMPDTVVVNCPKCQQPFSIDPATLGRQFKCSNCGQMFTASQSSQSPPPMMNYGSGHTTQKTSGMAITSLVCGLVICIPFSGLLAIIFGIIGITQTGPGKAKGRGMAIAGLIIGCLSLVFVTLAMLVSILLPSLNKARETANRAACAARMHQIGLAMIHYQNTNAMEYPPDLTTLMTVEQLPGSDFVCPSSNDVATGDPLQLETGGHCSYKYIYPGPGRHASASNTALLYENATDHANDGTNILFEDGHVMWFRTAQAQQYINKP